MKNLLNFITKPVFVAVIALGIGFIVGNIFPVRGLRQSLSSNYRTGFNSGGNYMQRPDGPLGRVQGQQGSPNFNNNKVGGFEGMGGRMGGPLTGEVVSADQTGITIKVSDDTLKKVTLDDTTTVYKNSVAEVSALTPGTKVTVFGTGMGNGTSGVEAVIIDWPLSFGGQAQQ